MTKRSTDELALITPDEFEELTGICKPTQAVMRHRRQIPFVNLSKRMPRYRRADIEDWIASRAVSVAK